MTSSASLRAMRCQGLTPGTASTDRLAHGQVLEQLRALERPTETEARAPRGREAMHVVTEDLDRTPAADESADRVHQRRLARAVRADEPDDLTRRNVEVDVVDHEPRAERNAELLDPDHRVERRRDLAPRHADVRGQRLPLDRRGRGLGERGAPRRRTRCRARCRAPAPNRRGSRARGSAAPRHSSADRSRRCRRRASGGRRPRTRRAPHRSPTTGRR